MGSGGGGEFRGGGIQDKYESVKEGKKTEINSYLQDLLRDKINQKDTEKINSRKEEILQRIKEEFEGSFDLYTGGSYSRQTYVNGLSDVDILVNLGNYSDSNIPDKENSKKVLEYIAERLRKRYPNTEVTTGKMAVTLKFSDGVEIQVLPAFRYHSGYKVPDSNTGGWLTTFPGSFKERMSEVNQKTGNRVKPTIKLVRYMLNKNNIELSSYHLENMALEAFDGYSGSKTHSDMALHLLNYAKTRVNTKTSDPSGQSDYVDENLGNNHNPTRKKLAKDIENVESKLKKSETKEEWKRVINGQ